MGAHRKNVRMTLLSWARDSVSSSASESSQKQSIKEKVCPGEVYSNNFAEYSSMCALGTSRDGVSVSSPHRVSPPLICPACF